MKMIALVLAAMLMLTGVAYAQDARKVDSAVPTPANLANRADCISDDYDCYIDQTVTAIPDVEPAGVLLGPIATDPGSTIQDVLLFIDIEHTFVGDLTIRLMYSHDCTDGYDAEGGVLDRPGVPDLTFGCSGDFIDWYGFDDTVGSIEDFCPSVFDPGCYGTDYDSVGLNVFDGLATGGCFWLHVTDSAGLDVGTVYAWEVCVLSEPVDPPSDGAFDIKPTSCPNPFNVKAQGKLPAAVLGTDAFDVMDIDVSTVMLEGTVEPIWHRYGDVSTPVGADAEPCECNEMGPDGYRDLKLKFMRQDIVDVLGPFEDGDEVELTLTGQLDDGTAFSFTDCIWILDKGKDATVAGDGAVSSPSTRESTETATWGTIKALYR